MKILNRPVMVLLALWCMAVLLVPVALADMQRGMQGPGGAGPATGGQGNTDQMQAPPSGGSGDSGSKGHNGGPGNGNGGQMSAPPSGAMGNLTALPDRSDGVQGGQNDAQSSGNQPSSQTTQQSKEDVIASLISQLQALLPGKK